MVYSKLFAFNEQVSRLFFAHQQRTKRQTHAPIHRLQKLLIMVVTPMDRHEGCRYFI